MDHANSGLLGIKRTGYCINSDATLTEQKLKLHQAKLYGKTNRLIKLLNWKAKMGISIAKNFGIHNQFAIKSAYNSEGYD